MLELMMLGGGRVINNTGPGPQTLIGSYSRAPGKLAGYYGSLNRTTLGLTNSSQFYVLTGTDSLGTNIWWPDSWFKFHLDDKVLFTPQRPCKAGISWLDLYKLGLISGEDPVVYPTGLMYYKQNKIITIGKYLYRVRLWRGAPTNPTRLGTTSGGYTATDPVELYGSEWNRLLYNIVSDEGLKGQEGAKWATYYAQTMGVGYAYGKWVICADLNSANNPWVFTRSGDALAEAGAVTYNSTNSNYGWWPVLELVGPA